MDLMTHLWFIDQVLLSAEYVVPVYVFTRTREMDKEL